jgi:hypothetical protein
MQTEAIIIRQAYPDDADALRRLGSLDSKRLPADSYLVAEVDSRLVAARGLDNGTIAADPFVPTAGVLALLELHARRLARDERRERRARRLTGMFRAQPAA